MRFIILIILFSLTLISNSFGKQTEHKNKPKNEKSSSFEKWIKHKRKTHNRYSNAHEKRSEDENTKQDINSRSSKKQTKYKNTTHHINSEAYGKNSQRNSNCPGPYCPPTPMPPLPVSSKEFFDKIEDDSVGCQREMGHFWSKGQGLEIILFYLTKIVQTYKIQKSYLFKILLKILAHHTIWTNKGVIPDCIVC